jgi:hypothetical protein
MGERYMEYAVGRINTSKEGVSMMEGIWHARFTAGDVHGEGLAVLHDGRIEGGDPLHTYTGSYQKDGSQIYANVHVTPCSGTSLPPDLVHPVTYFLQGSTAGDFAKVEGHVETKPESRLSVQLRKGE